MSKVLVLDLDDTLYAEIDYLRSAYRFIAKQLSLNHSTTKSQALYKQMIEQYHNREDVFEHLAKRYTIDKQLLIDWYRNHQPDITLYPNVKETLEQFLTHGKLALVTDGRSITQRNKIKALGLTAMFSSIVISEEIELEKPCRANFEKVMIDISGSHYYYVADNLSKDFITPNHLGWTSVCLKDQGKNVHRQNFNLFADDYFKPYLPKHCFESWFEIQNFLMS